MQNKWACSKYFIWDDLILYAQATWSVFEFVEINTFMVKALLQGFD